MHTLTDIIITGWPNDIKAVPCPLCPYWQHSETLTVKDGLVFSGEALIVPPLERERILQKLHQFHQGITKSQLLTHGCIFWPSINKTLKKLFVNVRPAPGSKPKMLQHLSLLYAKSVLPMADVCHGHLYPGRSWLPHMWWLLLQDDPHLMSSNWPEQHHQSHLTAQGNVLRAWNPGSPLLWQWSSIWKCPVCWFLHFLGCHPWDLKPSLSTIKWICRDMCRISEACTPKC